MDSDYGKLRDKLDTGKYKVTRQREAILQVLCHHKDEHMSAEEIYDRVRELYPDIGLATIYRTLDILTDLNMVHRLDFGDGRARYELVQDKPHHHHHLICLRCGSISEVKDDLLYQLEETVDREHGFLIVDHRLQFLGYCANCRDFNS
ncbi:MAG: Fur family transcriptional regulator [Bacillota bacterium]